ncbi:hypothetical protein BH09PAT2_BH09PAT2_04720 [soil metagenome]
MSASETKYKLISDTILPMHRSEHIENHTPIVTPTNSYRKIGFIITLILLSFAIILYFSPENELQPDTKISATLTPAVSQTEVVIPSDWKKYSGHGLSFSYPSNWILQPPLDTETIGNEKSWRFDRPEEGNMRSTMDITITKDYILKPGTSDVLRSYFMENGATISAGLKDTTFQTRRAVRYIDESNATDTLFVYLPEIHGVLSIYFPDSFGDLTLSQAKHIYLEPFLKSFKITQLDWKETKPVLKAESTIDTTL